MENIIIELPLTWVELGLWVSVYVVLGFLAWGHGKLQGWF